MAWEYIELNICPTGDKPVFHAAQYDIGRPIIIKLKNGDDDFTPTDLDIELQVRKVDNNVVTAVPDSVDGNVVTFLTTEQMTACSGTNLCELQLTSGDNTMATLHFFLVVQRDALQGGLSSQSEIHDLEDQIAAIVPEVIGDEYYTAAQVDELIDDIPTFDPSNYYDKTQLYTKTETNGLLAQKANTSALSTVAFTGDYDDLVDKPAIPDVSNYYTKSETYNQTEVNNLLATKADTSNLSTVATTGDYDDLINKPTIPAAQVQSDWSQSDNTQVDYIKNKPTVPGYATDLPISSTDPTNTKDYIDTGLSNKADSSNLSDVAFSGEYNDLLNKPTIPGYATDLPISDSDPTDTKSYIDTKTALNSIIKVTSQSGTTTGGGVLSKTFAHKVVVLSAWSSIDNCIVDIYKDGADYDNTGSLVWNFHCHNSSNQDWGNTNVTIRMTYIDYNA